MNRRGFCQRRGAPFALCALALVSLLGACARGADPQLAVDEQNVAAAREKLALDEQAGNAAVIGDDTHAFFLATQQLLHDRGELTQEEKRIEGGRSGHGGGHM